MADMVVIKAKIKEFVNEFSKKYYNNKKINVSGKFADALNEKVKGLIEDACKRATDNHRTTVMEHDV